METYHASDSSDNNEKMVKKFSSSTSSLVANGNLKNMPENISKSAEIANISEDKNNNSLVKSIVKSIVNVAKKSKSCEIFRNFVPCPGICDEESDFEYVLAGNKAILRNGKLKINGRNKTLYLNYLLSINNNDNCQFEVVSSFFKDQRCFPRNMPVITSNLVEFNLYKEAFTTDNRTEKQIWMTKILQAASNDSFEFKDYEKAGWCFIRALKSSWNATWIVLKGHKLYYNDNLTSKTVVIDLRKVRFVKSDHFEHLTENLLVESGTILQIDDFILITNSPQETKSWEKSIRENMEVKNSINDQKLSRNSIPIIVEKCISFIYLKGACLEGIYRKTGTNTRSAELLEKFKNDPFAVDLFKEAYSAHDVANVLKRFFRMLPKALLGQKATCYLSISKYSTIEDGKLDDFKELLKRLLPVEYKTIKLLLKHLKFISDLSKCNKMNIENLAKMWGYNISHVPELEEDDDNPLKYNPDEVKLVEELLTHYNYLFDDDDSQDLLSAFLTRKQACEDSDLEQIEIWTKTNELFLIDEIPDLTVNEACLELSLKLNIDFRSLSIFEVVDKCTLRRSLDGEEAPECNFCESRLVIGKKCSEKFKKTPQNSVKYANNFDEVLKPCIIIVQANTLNILDEGDIKETIDLQNVVPYLGKEATRAIFESWTITLVEKNWDQRSSDVPYIGAVICGNDPDDQIMWYTKFCNLIE